MTITIYDIAKEANTSISTVSRYLNGKPVRKKTASRIEETIKKYNYTPNLIAKGLVSKSLKTIAILLPDIRVYHYAEIAYFLESLFRNNGYNTILCNFPIDDIQTCKDIISMLKSRNVDAYILISSFLEELNNHPDILDLLSNVPVVTENFKLNIPNASSVMLDDYQGIKIALDYLINKKNKKNIFYVQDTVSKSATIKMNSFLDNYNNSKDHIYMALRSTEGGYNVVNKILKEHPETDAIIFEEEVTAFGGLKACNDLNLIPGKDIDIVGYNKSQYSSMCTPELTYIDTLDNKQSDTIREVLKNMMDEEGTIKTFDEVVIPELVVKQSA